MPWKVFIATESAYCRRGLRRYSSGSSCPKGQFSYHNVEVIIDPMLPVAVTDLTSKPGEESEFEGDPRWPTHCECGYKFHPEDSWQVNVNHLYEGDGRELFILREAPIGAAWHAPWLDHPKWSGPDGKAWCVMMPGGNEWIVYGPSANGKPWDVKGTIPNITVSPSIGIKGHYHGFIKHGVISEDVDRRKFEGVPRTA